MKHPFLDTVRDASMRLDRTIVRYNDQPIYIHRVNEHFRLEAHYLKTGDRVPEDALQEPEAFDFSPVLLGYANGVRCDATYVTRVPRRRWKQGLNAEAIKGMGGRDMAGPYLYKTIVNDYPTFSKALRRSVDYNYATAFHRHYAVFNSGTLVSYKRTVIGEVVDGKIVVMPAYIYLLDEIKEIVGEKYC